MPLEAETLAGGLPAVQEHVVGLAALVEELLEAIGGAEVAGQAVNPVIRGRGLPAARLGDGKQAVGPVEGGLPQADAALRLDGGVGNSSHAFTSFVSGCQPPGGSYPRGGHLLKSLRRK